MTAFSDILNWMESWAPLIPIAFYVICWPQLRYLRPLVLYFFIAFLFNTAANAIWQRDNLNLKLVINNNNPIYNVHSVVRFILLYLFFFRLNQQFSNTIKQLLAVFFVLFTLINFLLIEPFIDRRIANNLHAAEAGVILVYCLLYYFNLLNQETVEFRNRPEFWAITGLSIFVIIGFPIYLFYDKILDEHIRFTIDIWKIQKIAFLIFCLFTSFAFYLSKRIKL